MWVVASGRIFAARLQVHSIGNVHLHALVLNAARFAGHRVRRTLVDAVMLFSGGCRVDFAVLGHDEDTAAQ